MFEAGLLYVQIRCRPSPGLPGASTGDTAVQRAACSRTRRDERNTRRCEDSLDPELVLN
jgi:hypothetical protein